MDELKLSLKTKFMKGIISKLIGRAVFKQTGIDVNINLDELDITTQNGDAYIRLNLVAKVDEKEIVRAMTKL